MKKQTRKSLTNKLDKECSRVVRARGECQRCGYIPTEEHNTLQCCHIYSRVYRSVRWDLGNLLCLCAGCHFWGHKNPCGFTELVRSILGDKEYEYLKGRAEPIKKWTLQELEDILEWIKGQ